MKAEEMFKKLDYHKIEDGSIIQYTKNEDTIVRFWKNTKCVELFGCNCTWDLESMYYIENFKLFEAIYEQIKELGGI